MCSCPVRVWNNHVHCRCTPFSSHKKRHSTTQLKNGLRCSNKAAVLSNYETVRKSSRERSRGRKPVTPKISKIPDVRPAYNFWLVWPMVDGKWPNVWLWSSYIQEKRGRKVIIIRIEEIRKKSNSGGIKCSIVYIYHEWLHSGKQELKLRIWIK